MTLRNNITDVLEMKRKTDEVNSLSESVLSDIEQRSR